MKEFNVEDFKSSELKLIPNSGEGKKIYVKYLGGVQAGFPSPAEDVFTKELSLDERYFYKPESTFIVEVSSLSMFPEYRMGDKLILRSDIELRNGYDVVVSINSCDYTLKRWDEENRVFKSLNPKYPDLTFDEEDTVIMMGIVGAQIRDRLNIW